MKARIANINAVTKRVEYDIYKDDETTLISAGESADYSESIPSVTADTSFADFAAVMIADATAKKDDLTAKLTASKTANESKATALADANAAIDSQITDLGTAVSAFA